MNSEIKIYVIHYSKLEERKQNIESILNPLKVDYEFIEDYDKEDLENIDTNDFYIDDRSIFNEKVKLWKEKANCKNGDMLLIMCGEAEKTRKALGVLRLKMGEDLGLRNPEVFAPLWVVDFPLLEWDEDTNRFHAMHHPFTAPKKEDTSKIQDDPKSVRANAYDLVLNGNEIGGGSIRIHDKELQKTMLHHLGFSEEEAREQFGFLMDAFEYGAPPHGGIAFGFDRLCAILGGEESIRDFIAFPKNNSGRDIMIDSPSKIDTDQLDELNIKIK